MAVVYCNHSAVLLSPSTAVSSSLSSTSSSLLVVGFKTLRFKSRSVYSKTRVSPVSALSSSSPPPSRSLEALIFDCDGVILESENLHRQAYNDAFSHFDVRCPPSSSESLDWSLDFYDKFQNLVGGGKPKMRWYFKENGWPTSTIFVSPPESDDDRAKLIDTLQDWKTERYKEIIKSGSVEPRPGVIRLMDEAKAAGKKLAVCSAATKSSVIMCLENLIDILYLCHLRSGSKDLIASLQVISSLSLLRVTYSLGMSVLNTFSKFSNPFVIAGDDVKEKKPDPSIYITAAEKLGVSVKDCLVIEDSVIGLQAATKAGMSCVITYTSSTSDQDFKDAISVYPDLSNVKLKDLETLLQTIVTAA